MTYTLKSTDPVTVAAAKAQLDALNSEYAKMGKIAEEVTERYGAAPGEARRGVSYRRFFNHFLVVGIQGSPGEQQVIADGWRFNQKWGVFVPDKRTAAGREWDQRLSAVGGRVVWGVPGVPASSEEPLDREGRGVWHSAGLLVTVDGTTAYYRLGGENAESSVAAYQERTGETAGWEECLPREFKAAQEALESQREAKQSA